MVKDPEDYLRQLLTTKDISQILLEKAVEKTAHLVDLSSHFNSAEGTQLALEWCNVLEKRDLTPGQRCRLNFYRANAWDDRRKREHKGEGYEWDWGQTELRHQLLSLRCAVDADGLSTLHPTERAMIQTNLANQLNTAGRVVDAVEEWNNALAANSKFAMALGNRGYGWFNYSRAHYDPGHKHVFLYRAHQSLSAALAKDADWGSAPPRAREFFTELREEIDKRIDIENLRETVRLDGHGLGRSQKERAYRRWCLDNCLFLNPLNDLGAYSIAAQDVLSLPSYNTPINEGPTLIGFFNQLKQEFASSRWQLYEGTLGDTPHFSDRNVKLLNTMDYPSYSLSTEKVKLAFRSAYSLLDKIAFFLNDYLGLTIPLRDVSFPSIWFEKRGTTTLRPAFQKSRNWPLRGLYWLAMDFVDKEFRVSTAPDARDFYEIRNHLEHRYLKVHEFSPPKPTYGLQPDGYRYDRLAHSIGRRELNAKTLRLFKLTRAALIYMCLAMKEEERQRSERKPNEPDKFGPMPMLLDTWDDQWKR
jgi:hypothetical protein